MPVVPRSTSYAEERLSDPRHPPSCICPRGRGYSSIHTYVDGLTDSFYPTQYWVRRIPITLHIERPKCKDAALAKCQKKREKRCYNLKLGYPSQYRTSKYKI
jgi:hypothetical protein